jgi:chaperonin cofactor prefoldin
MGVNELADQLEEFLKDIKRKISSILNQVSSAKKDLQELESEGNEEDYDAWIEIISTANEEIEDVISDLYYKIGDIN